MDSTTESLLFDLSDEQVQIRDALRRYLDKEVAPLVDKYEHEEKLVPMSVVQRMREFGLLGGMLPAADGGFGLPASTYGMLIAELARTWPSLRSIVSTSNLAASVISDGGSTEMKNQVLPRVLDGQVIASFALSEPNIGSDAASLETRASPVQNGWLVNGRKLYISLGPVCELGVVFVRTGPQASPRNVSCLLFDRSMPGITVTSIPKMGMHSCPLGEILFEDVFIPHENLIGDEGRGFSLAKKYLNIGRSVVAFSALGIAQSACDAAVLYAKQRHQFGKPIGSFQLVQQLVADMLTLVETSSLLCYRSAHALDRQSHDAAYFCSMAKRYCTDAVLRVAEMSMQVHGGAGYTKLFPVERYYRDARHLSIAEGTNQIQAMLIASQVLGLSALR